MTADRLAVEARLAELERETLPLEWFVDAFAGHLGPPLYYHSGKSHAGFRYPKPELKHFCLLKLARAVSALNAMICLARQGFSQEIGVLVRTVAECTTLVEFVLVSRDASGCLNEEASELVQTYFADFARNDITDHKKSKLRQGRVHDLIGAELDSFLAQHSGEDALSTPAERLYSRTYLAFSGYVHCKYPETMDLVGGEGPHFHLRGMTGTPKDDENVALIETFLESVVLCTRSIIVRLELLHLIGTNARLLAWYRKVSAVSWHQAS